ncbi:MAG: acetyl-CoA carboxylase, biotin carboxyl carrier protein [Bacilli bacterium]|nr:acetyl-CoA carboxylase, biotin carboxyl carrier protein [Bacilli bacterium]
MKTMSEILEFIREFEKTKLSSIELEMGDVKIKLKKEISHLEHFPAPKIHEDNPKSSGDPLHEDLIVRSPLVGTYYASSSPEARPFISVGDSVHKGDTLCIIEAMKTMNQIKSPVDGFISEIHVKNQEFVGYDQALVSIQHDT